MWGHSILLLMTMYIILKAYRTFAAFSHSLFVGFYIPIN